MDPEKHSVPRRKVNKKTFRKKTSGKDVAKDCLGLFSC